MKRKAISKLLRSQRYSSYKNYVRGLLKKYRIYPERKFGQNFLIDKRVIKKIIETANLKPKDTVLEVGPGIGNLTQELAKTVHPVKCRSAAISPSAKLFNRTGKVIAIEKDPKMIKILKETLKDFKNIKIIQGDVLKIKNSSIAKWLSGFKIIANLPYYIVAPVIRKFLEIKSQPQYMILMVQKEVAQRICAKPPAMNLLAVSVQFYAKPEIISFVSKKSFWPQPKVDGAILRIAPLINTDKKLIDSDLFFKVVKAGFSQPRKQLVNNLSKGLKLNKEKIKSWLLKNNIKSEQRAETLTLKDWGRLAKNFKNR